MSSDQGSSDGGSCNLHLDLTGIIVKVVHCVVCVIKSVHFIYILLLLQSCGRLIPVDPLSHYHNTHNPLKKPTVVHRLHAYTVGEIQKSVRTRPTVQLHNYLKIPNEG